MALAPLATPVRGARLIAPPLMRRMAAFLYEGVLLFGVCVATGWIYGPLIGQTHALKGRFGLEAVLFIVLGLYFIWFWLHGGQTLAMKTWYIRLVDRSGHDVPLVRAAVRYFLGWTWFAPLALAYTTGMHPREPKVAMTFGLLMLGWMAFYALLSYLHPERQFLHDVLAGTRLVDTRDKKSP